MDYQRLGRTGLDVSVLGVGAEYLRAFSSESIAKIVSEALEVGINYFDLVWNLPNIIDGFKAALDRYYGKVVLALHLGSCIKKGKYYSSRNSVECERQLKGFMVRRPNVLPIVNVHYVANLKVWQEVNKRGILLLAGS